ncbi:MAG TPA: CapA family protein [Dehalococcoidia bacterium]|nr:CapA family protein [Dehalococcoidia bacterium]
MPPLLAGRRVRAVWASLCVLLLAVAATACASPPDSARPTTAPSITIDAVGDISLAREVVAKMAANGAGYPFALVAPMLDGDVNIGNLEGPFTERGEPWAKGYNFRTPPQFAPALNAGHIDLVTLANNHIMDYGTTGLADTLDALRAADIQYTGVLEDASAPIRPTVIRLNGMRVAMLGFVTTPDEVGGFTISEWAPGADRPGVVIGTPALVSDAVAAARRDADFVIVLEHAGDEYVSAPNATQRELADAALEAGADAYIGAHAHLPQPVELRGHQLVAYGLGNFVFALDSDDLAGIPEPRVAPILKLTLTKGVGVTSFEIKAVALDENEHRPRPATEDEAAALAASMQG